MRPVLCVAIPCSDSKSYALHQVLRTIRQLEAPEHDLCLLAPVDAEHAEKPAELLCDFRYRYPHIPVEILPVTLLWDTEKGDENRWTDRALIAARLRQAALLKAREMPEVTHLFFAGCDMLFPPDTLTRLLSLDANLACGTYCARHQGFCLLLSWDRESRLWEPVPWRQEVYEVDWCGADCLLVKRAVFERVDWEGYTHEAYRAGEDAWICHRTFEEFGTRVWADGTLLIPHLREHGQVVYPVPFWHDVVRVRCPYCKHVTIRLRNYVDREESCRRCGLQFPIQPFWEDLDIVLRDAARPPETWEREEE